MSEVKRFKPVINSTPYTPYAYCEENEDGIYVRIHDYATLKAERDALAAKGMELCREAAHVYEKYNVTQMPDMDLVDYQTIQEFSDLVGCSINTEAYANQLRAEGVEMVQAKLQRMVQVAHRSEKERIYALSLKAGEIADTLRKENCNG